MSSLYYTSTFYSKVTNTGYKIEIKAKTLTAGNETEFKLRADGFKVKWNKGKDEKLSQIKTSKLTFGFIIENETDRDAINEILSYTEGEFYIVVTLINSLTVYYTGWIKPAYNKKSNNFYPFITQVTCTDSLNRLQSKYNNTLQTDGAFDYKDLYNPLKIFYDLFDITSLPIAQFSIKTIFNFWPQNLVYTPTSTNALRLITYNRNAFVSNQGNQPNTVKNYLVEFNGVLKSFGLSLIYSDNFYNIIHDNALVNDAPYYWQSNTPDTTATEVNLNSGTTFLPYTIENDFSLSNLYAHLKSGASYSSIPELNTVRGTYKKGSVTAIFDPDNEYNALTTIGFVNQGLTNLNLNLSVRLTEIWPDTVTPNAQQNSFQTGVIACTLKVGNKYLSSNGAWGGTSTVGWEWNTNPNSEFFLASGFGITDTEQYQFLTQTEGIITNYTSNTPTGFDTAVTNAITINLPLPALDVFGEVQFKLAGKIYFWQLPSNTVNYPGTSTPIVTLIQNLNTFNMPVSSGLNATQQPTTRTIEIKQTPIISSLTEGTIGNDAENTNGSLYISGQTPDNENTDKDLGSFALGNLYEEDSTQHTVRLKTSGGTYIDTGGFDIGAGTTYKNLTQLVLNEYMRTSDEPTTILNGTVLFGKFLPTRPLKYRSTLGGFMERFIFIEGTYTAATDETSGSWYKLNISNATLYEDTTDLYYPDFPGETDPGSTGTPAFSQIGNPGFNTANFYTPEGAITKTVYNDKIIGVVDEDLLAGTSHTKFDVAYIRGKVYNGQKLIICDKFGNNALEITASAESLEGSTQIDANFTTLAPYLKGSLCLVQTWDLSNRITGSGGGVTQIIPGTNVTISPASGTGNVTINASGGGTPASPTNSVQFNDGGNFGGETAFRYFPTSNDLYVTNTNSHFFGTNIGHRSYFEPNFDELWFFLTAQDFHLGDSSRYFMYSRDGSETVQNGYDSRAPIRIASSYLPIGYRVVAYEVYTNSARPLLFRISPFDGTATAVVDSGTTNTINGLATPYTTVVGEYVSLLVQTDRASTQVYGGRIRLIKA